MRERFMVITMIEMTGYIYDENDDMAPVMDAILQWRMRSEICLRRKKLSYTNSSLIRRTYWTSREKRDSRLI